MKLAGMPRVVDGGLSTDSRVEGLARTMTRRYIPLYLRARPQIIRAGAIEGAALAEVTHLSFGSRGAEYQGTGHIFTVRGRVMASDDGSGRRSESATSGSPSERVLSLGSAPLPLSLPFPPGLQRQSSFVSDVSEPSARGGTLYRGSTRGVQPDAGAAPRVGAFRSAVKDLKRASLAMAMSTAGAGQPDGSLRGGNAFSRVSLSRVSSSSSIPAELEEAGSERQTLRRTGSAKFSDDGATS